jgi:integrase
MAVFNKNGNWWIDFRDQYGRRHRQKVGKSKKMADKAHAKKVAAVAEKRFLDVKTNTATTFAQLAKDYRNHIKHRSYYAKDNHRLLQLEKQFGGKLLVEITTLDVERYKQQVTPRGKIAWNRLRSMLHHMFAMGKKWGLCDHNPVTAVERYKESSGKTRFLSPTDELPRFVDAAARPDVSPDAYPMLATAVFTGLRRSELFRLRWNEVDFVTNSIHVNRLAKSRRSREVPMAKIVREALLSQQKKTGALPYVFCTQAGKPFKDRRETLAVVLEHAGITEPFTWHDMRHSFASYLAMAGVDLLRIRDLLGHSDVKMTLRYAHLSPSYVRDGIQRLEAFTPSALPRLPAPTADQENPPSPPDQSIETVDDAHLMPAPEVNSGPSSPAPDQSGEPAHAPQPAPALAAPLAPLTPPQRTGEGQRILRCNWI